MNTRKTKFVKDEEEFKEIIEELIDLGYLTEDEIRLIKDLNEDDE